LSFYPRRAEARIAEAMADTPVVLVVGPRQAGKTTLVRRMVEHNLRYLTLDDELTLLAAREDPVGMIRSLDRVRSSMKFSVLRNSSWPSKKVSTKIDGRGVSSSPGRQT
jgi:ABC-type phosphate/phosphonate transport system ATPase subunit